MKVNTRLIIDKEVKGKAQKMADKLGISLDTLINVLLKKIIRDQGIYLSLKSNCS